MDNPCASMAFDKDPLFMMGDTVSHIKFKDRKGVVLSCRDSGSTLISVGVSNAFKSRLEGLYGTVQENLITTRLLLIEKI